MLSLGASVNTVREIEGRWRLGVLGRPRHSTFGSSCIFGTCLVSFIATRLLDSGNLLVLILYSVGGGICVPRLGIMQLICDVNNMTDR